MHTWAPDVVLHITNSDDYFRVMQSTMIEVMNDMREACLTGPSNQKAGMAKALNGICRDLVVMEERRRMAVDQVGGGEHDPNAIIEEKEQQIADDLEADARRKRGIEQAKEEKLLMLDKVDEDAERERLEAANATIPGIPVVEQTAREVVDAVDE